METPYRVPDSITPEVGWRCWSVGFETPLSHAILVGGPRHGEILEDPPLRTPIYVTTPTPAWSAPTRNVKVDLELDSVTFGTECYRAERGSLYGEVFTCYLHESLAADESLDLIRDVFRDAAERQGAPYLVSPQQGTRWPLHKPLRATKGCPCPAATQLCGIHAVREREVAVDYAVGAFVLGQVELWGKVIPGTKGFRAEIARPVSLVQATNRDESRLYAEPHIVRELARAYGCEVLHEAVPPRAAPILGISAQQAASSMAKFTAAMAPTQAATQAASNVDQGMDMLALKKALSRS